MHDLKFFQEKNEQNGNNNIFYVPKKLQNTKAKYVYVYINI